MSIIDSVATSYLESLNRHQVLFETMEAYHQEVMQLLEACHSALQAGVRLFGLVMAAVRLMLSIWLQSLWYVIS